MRKSTISTTLIVLASPYSSVSAANICAFTTRSCSLGAFSNCCTNISAGTCCIWPANFGWAVAFTGLPMNGFWQGRTYGDTCNTLTSGGGSSSGQTCSVVFNSTTSINWKSGNWISTAPVGRAVQSGDASECVAPDVMGFMTESGEEQFVKVPEGRLDEVNQLVQAGKFDELAKLEIHSMI